MSRCEACGNFPVPPGTPVAERLEMLETLVKALASDPSVYGSDSFVRARDQLNPHHQALLLEVLR